MKTNLTKVIISWQNQTVTKKDPGYFLVAAAYVWKVSDSLSGLDEQSGAKPRQMHSTRANLTLPNLTGTVFYVTTG